MSRKFLNCGHAGRAGGHKKDHRKVTCPQPRRVSVCPNPMLCCRGRTGVLRAGSDAMSSVCRALLPGDSHHMWEAAGHWAASAALPAPQWGWNMDIGRAGQTPTLC